MWIKKSHYPMTLYKDVLNKCNKIICCVRNPYDVFASFMYYYTTMDHSGQINEKFQEHPEIFDKFFKESVQSFKAYH